MGFKLRRDDLTEFSWPPHLDRRFRLIVLDWDGTAVDNRRQDASAVRERFVHLLQLGVRIVITTGTNFANIDHQLTATMQGTSKVLLFISSNRGSEIYGFGADSAPILRHRVQATPEEDRVLTAITDAVREAIVTRTGLRIDVVYDRLNRRKLDLIPLPEWADPPKAQIGVLAAATNRRLEQAGLAGGIRAVVEMAQQTSERYGLPNVRITSDAKNVEIGLTDKSDAMDWVMREIAQPAAIATSDILIAGDEFGPVGGTSGSDARTLIPAVSGSTAVSVGPEPAGVPAGVLQVGGGPAHFLALIDQQLGRWQAIAV